MRETDVAQIALREVQGAVLQALRESLLVAASADPILREMFQGRGETKDERG
jgi:hypothetical protein